MANWNKQTSLKRALGPIFKRLNLNVSKITSTVAARRCQILNYHDIQCVLDIGANHGQWARSLRASGYQGRMVSFEPVTEVYERLLAHSMGDPNWTAVHAGIGTADGSGDINVTRHRSFSSLKSPGSYPERETGTQVIGTERVKLLGLDTAVEEYTSPSAKNAVKLDVQGMEHDIMESAHLSVGRVPIVELEMAFYSRYTDETVIAQAIAQMYAMGYRLCLVENVHIDDSGGCAAMNGVFVAQGQ